MSKRRIKLPNKIIAIENPDKTFHEKWEKGDNPLNLPHPFRLLCMGPPHSGKTLICKNIILRQEPPFERIVVFHGLESYTQEYDDCDAEIYGAEEIPEPGSWDGQLKTLVILDDIEYSLLDKHLKHNLDRLFGSVSTHMNVSVICCAQNGINIPSGCRRSANVFVIWDMPDLDSMNTLSRKTGLRANEMREIFDRFMEHRHDSLWIDRTINTPYPLRRNGFDLIIKERDEENKDLKFKGSRYRLLKQTE